MILCPAIFYIVVPKNVRSFIEKVQNKLMFYGSFETNVLCMFGYNTVLIALAHIFIFGADTMLFT